MNEIKVGDKVILKSGGPIMTVQEIGDYTMTGGPEEGALCVWFDGKKPMDKIFAIKALEDYLEN